MTTLFTDYGFNPDHAVFKTSFALDNTVSGENHDAVHASGKLVWGNFTRTFGL